MSVHHAPGRGGVGRCLLRLVLHPPGGVGVCRCLTSLVNHPQAGRALRQTCGWKAVKSINQR